MSRKFFLLAFLMACKSDPVEKPATTAAPSAEQQAPSGKARSGKIDLPPRTPSLPGADPAPSLPSDDRREVRRRERMERLDTDGDGEVSEAERQAARDERQKSMLERFDTDKDGTISDAERQAVMRDRINSMRTRLDADGDGKVTPDELTASRFGRFDGEVDTNKDGDVSADELDAAMKARGGRRWGGRGAPRTGSGSAEQ